jgi:hypothetical protein
VTAPAAWDAPLFDLPPARERARVTDPATSHAAAASVQVSGKAQAFRLLAAWCAAGPAGLTDEQAATRSGIGTDGGHYTKRCSDLRRMGLIAGTDDVRAGRSGRAARVSVSTAAGRAAVFAGRIPPEGTA